MPFPLSSEENEAFSRALSSHLQNTLSDRETQIFLNADGSPEVALAIAANLDTEHRSKSKSRRLAEHIRHAVGGFKRYFHSIELVVSLHPEVATIVWGGIKLAFELIAKFSEYFESIEAILVSLLQVLRFYDDYATKLYQHWPQVQEALSDFYRDVLKFCSLIYHTFKHKNGHDRSWAKVLTKAVFSRVSPFDLLRTSFDEHSAAIQREVEHADRRIAQLHYKLVAAEQHTQQHERSTQRDERAAQENERLEQARERALQQEERRAQHARDKSAQAREERERNETFLSLLKPINCSSRHKWISEETSKGTAQWIFERCEFKEWMGGKNIQNRLLWCYGNAGSGKTFITTSVINRLQQHVEQNPGQVLALLFELLRQDQAHDMLTEISGCCNYYNSADDLDLEDLLTKACSIFQKVYIVVDALDECHEVSAALSALRKLSACAHLLVASRDERSIRHALGSHIILGIHGPELHNDIRVYIDQEVRARVTQRDLVARDANLISRISDALRDGANGMFLWVSLQLQSLSEQITDADICAALNELPRGIDATYDRCIQRIEALGKRRSLRCQRVFKCIIAAIHPLELQRLVDVIGVAEMEDGVWNPQHIANDPQSVIDDCAGLCMVDPESNAVTLIHGSFRDFLLTSQARCHESFPAAVPSRYFRFDLPVTLFDAHVSIAEIYAKYLELKVASAKLEDPLVSVERFLKQVSALSWPYVYRAQDGFAKHVYAGTHSGSGSTTDSIDTCVGMRLLNLALRIWKVSPTKHPWHLAALVGPLYLADFACGLVARGFSVDEILDARYGTRVLHWAAQNGHFDVCKALLKLGADVNGMDVRRRTPLHAIAWVAQEQPLVPMYPRASEAHVSDLQSYVNTMMLLVLYGVNGERQDLDGETALLCASVRGPATICKVLLSFGANFNQTNKHGNTAIHLVASNGDCDLLDTLVKCGADLNLANNRGETSLHCAAQRVCGKDLTLVKVMAVLSKDYYKKTTATIVWLTTHGANLNYRNSLGATPLHILFNLRNVALYQRLDMVKPPKSEQGQEFIIDGELATCIDGAIFLLQHGANLLLVDFEGRTPTHILAENMDTLNPAEWMVASAFFVFIAMTAPKALSVRDNRGRLVADALPPSWSTRLNSALWRIAAHQGTQMLVPSQQAFECLRDDWCTTMLESPPKNRWRHFVHRHWGETPWFETPLRRTRRPSLPLGYHFSG